MELQNNETENKQSFLAKHKKKALAFAVGAVTALSTVSTFADEVTPTAITPDNILTTEQINAITNLTVKGVDVSQDGAFSLGTLFLGILSNPMVLGALITI